MCQPFSICDQNYRRHVGYSENNWCIQKLYAPETIRLISRKITELTLGVNPENRPIILPDRNICDLIDSVYQNFRPETGDIYTRYIVGSNEQGSLVQQIINQVIEIAVTDIRNNIGMEECNKKMTQWVTLLGDFNQSGLRQYSKIYTRNKRPKRMMFNMNY